jgi:hypothetical protein
VFELDAEPHPELLEIAPQRAEVDPELGGDGTRLIGRERSLRGQLDIRCQTIYCQSDRMATVHLLIDRVSGDPTVEWSRTVPIPSPTGREVGHRRVPAVQRVSQMRLPAGRAHDQVTGIRTRRPVELFVRPARHLRPERSAA